MRYSVFMARLENTTYILLLLALAFFTLKPSIPGLDPRFGIAVGEFLILVVFSYHLFFRLIKNKARIHFRGITVDREIKPRLYKCVVSFLSFVWFALLIIFTNTIIQIAKR